jgi:uncharacterized membrane protein
MTERRPADRDEKETGRIEAFSDGVYAIAITLLVLELKVPHGLDARGLREALVHQWPAYAAFLVSFLSIGIMWINHHRLFGLIRRSDEGLLVLNGLQLLTVTVVPFPTALVAEYMGHDGGRLAAAVYTGWSMVIGAAYNGLWRYVASPARGPRLLRVPLDAPEVLAIQAQYRLGPLWYGIAFAMSFLSPALAIGLCGLLALYYAIPPRPPRAERAPR